MPQFINRDPLNEKPGSAKPKFLQIRSAESLI